MARSAGDGSNTIDKDQMSAYLDRWVGLDKDAEKIMMAAMKKCKDGPRADQSELRTEMKDAGIRMKTFNALLKVRKHTDKAAEAAKDLVDDDLAQFEEIAGHFEDDENLFASAIRKAGGLIPV